VNNFGGEVLRAEVRVRVRLLASHEAQCRAHSDAERRPADKCNPHTIIELILLSSLLKVYKAAAFPLNFYLRTKI
jgi:hypothetical protein